jgi:hypothetical protein
MGFPVWMLYTGTIVDGSFCDDTKERGKGLKGKNTFKNTGNIERIPNDAITAGGQRIL